MIAEKISFWKDQNLTGISVLPEKEPIEKTVILLHGFSGNAESNLGFARKIRDACPQTEIIVIDGLSPVPPGNDTTRRQWYPLPETADAEGYQYSFMPYYLPAEKQRQMRTATFRIQETAKILNDFLLNLARKKQTALSRFFLCGISQGGITAYEMLLFRKELHQNVENGFPAGLIVIGAGIHEADRLNAIRVGTLPAVPVLLARGRRDEIFPKTVDYFSAAQLRRHRIPVEITEADSVHFGLEHAVCDVVCDFIRKHGIKNL